MRYIHGYSAGGKLLPTLRVFYGMRDRCYKPTNPAYANYGGRGIKVCARWRTSFVNFLADMGEKPPGKTLERNKNNRSYSPKNCRWASRFEQAQNRRGSRLITFGERTFSISVWARILGLSPSGLAYRVGVMPVAEAFCRPIKGVNRRPAKVNKISEETIKKLALP